MTQVAAVPDYLGGVIARIKAHPDTVAKVGGQVSAALGSTWKDHTYAVLCRRAGSPGEDPSTRRLTAFIDTFWYGPSEYEANKLWGAAHYWVCPNQDAANTYRPGPPGLVFDEVVHMGGPLFQVESSTGWPYVVVRYAFIFSMVGIP